MLISKFDLYKPEWLELVFDDRNKAYGAYELRQHYAQNMVKAMGITFFGVALLFGAIVILKTKPVPVIPIVHDPSITIHLSEIKQPVTPPKKIVEPVKPPAPLKTTQLTQYVVKPDALATNPPVIDKIVGAIGQTTTPGTLVDPGPIEPATTGKGTEPVVDNTVHPLNGLDVMPEPVGGSNAWNKFLSKNLRFPAQAQDDQVSGRVILSFVIEKNGQLSNIVVEQGAGHGFDEEALRVLKLAKAWKPGMQNGQAVRVKYAIPINFQLADPN
jgi:protein TonB